MSLSAALRSTSIRWGAVARFFHWSVALLILAQATIGLYMIGLPLSVAKLKIFLLHKSLGLTVFALVLLRLAWRLYDARPLPPVGMATWQQRLARLTHLALYLLLVVMPLSGWVYNSASGFPLPWFGLVQLPAIAPTSKSLAAAALLVHKSAFWSLMVLLALHVGAALDHHWRVGDDVLRRMLPFAKGGRS
ncbi:cytochrome b [Acidihalobacter prosperus]